MLNIAIVHSLPYHYEVLGCIIYYCYRKRYSSCLFTNNDNHDDWLHFYTLYFQRLGYFFRILDVRKFDPTLYSLFDYIYVPTSDDPSSPAQYADKCIVHLHHTKSFIQPAMKNVLYTRRTPYLDLPFVTPVFPIHLTVERLPRRDKIILLVGRSNDNFPLIAYLSAYFRVCLINRFIIPDMPKNVILFENPSAFEMMYIISQADFIGCLITEGHNHIEVQMTGAITLAISNQIPLIIPTKMNESYRLQSAICYDPVDFMSSDLVREIRNYNPDTETLRTELDTVVRTNEHVLDAFFIPVPVLYPPATTETVRFFIHFIWFLPFRSDPNISAKLSIPEKYLANMQSFRHVYPDAEIIIWSESMFLDMLESDEFLRQFRDVWNQTSTSLMKCDVARICIVWKYGGMYSDLDFLCLRAMPLGQETFMIFYEPDEHARQLRIQSLDKLVMNSIFYSMYPQHPILYTMLMDIKSDPYWCINPINPINPINDIYSNMCFAGSLRWTRVFNRHNWHHYVRPSYLVSPITDENTLSQKKNDWHAGDACFMFTVWADDTGCNAEVTGAGNSMEKKNGRSKRF